jgi:capsular polysaccharide transport system permease protein
MKIDTKISSAAASAPALAARKRRRWPSRLIAVLCVLGPTALAAVYAWGLATPQYEAEAAFIIRGPEDQGGGGGGSLFSLGGPAANGQALDGYAVAEYARSHGALEELRKRVPYDTMMTKAGDDLLMRYRIEPGAESDIHYFNRMVNVEFSLTRQIVTMRVYAFTPEDAKAIAVAMIDIVETFANRMNEKARNDLLRAAQREVDMAASDLRDREAQILRWRFENNNIDPAKFTEMVMNSISRVEEALIEARIDLSRLSNLVDPGERGRELEARISVLSGELQHQQQRLTGGGDDTAARQTMVYEQLVLSREISTELYETAVESLSMARAEADRQQKFLVLLQEAFADNSADWPNGPSLVGTTFLASLLAFWIGRFLYDSATEGLHG